MDSLQQQLAQLRKRVASIDAKYASNPPQLQLPSLSGHLGQGFVGLDGQEVGTSAGKHWEIEKAWPLSQRHGGFHLSALHDFEESLLEAISEREVGQVRPEEIVFVDTETTGLAGGTGTYPFLIGAGAIRNGHFQVKQFFARGPGEEASQLAALAEYLQPFRVLVTYNGKAFDIPLLETRFRMARTKPPFASLYHLDLLFGARRLWKLQFESCRLVQLEQQVLGYTRVGDVPGALIPQLYFGFLRTGDPSPLLGIFQHNALDILSLACITIIIPQAIQNPSAMRFRSGLEMLGLGKWLGKVKRLEEAAALYRRALQTVLPPEVEWRALWECAALEKKAGRLAMAAGLWSELTTVSNPFRQQAYEELAKYYERQEKNPNLALEMTRAALSLGPTAELNRRQARLEKRLGSPRLL